MGINKPYEVEVHQLGPALPMHMPLDLRANMEALVVPAPDGVSVAGRHLRIAPDERPQEVVQELRERLLRRMRERRPDADRRTWSSFTSLVRSLLRDGAALDESVEHELIATIDGL